MERLFIICIFLRVTVCSVCSAATFQNDLSSHIGVSTDTEVHFIEIPSMFSCRTPFWCYDLQPSLHCSPVTITPLEIVLNSLTIFWKTSCWSATMKFILCLYQQETRHFTWKSSQRSSIGRADAILNDKIRNEKKLRLPLNNAHRQKLEIPVAKRRPKQNCANGTGISVPSGWNGKRGILQKVSVCSGKFPVELRVPFAFKPVEKEILPTWKAPQVSVLERCTIWESCLYCKLEHALNKGLESNFTAMTNKQQCQTRNEQRNREEQLPERRRQFSSPPWIAVQKSVTTWSRLTVRSSKAWASAW